MPPWWMDVRHAIGKNKQGRDAMRGIAILRKILVKEVHASFETIPQVSGSVWTQSIDGCKNRLLARWCNVRETGDDLDRLC